MKTTAKIFLSLLLAVSALTCPPARAASTSELLQQGLYAEEVDGNINSAIKIYSQVITSGSASGNQVAQALYRQGMCYLKIKDEPAARTALEKLVNDYPNQTDLVEKARPVLDDLTDFDPAALMPANTLVYAEFGSPGKQIDTILTMLKGTPFENPLAAIGGNSPSNPGQKTPGDIMGALLNPSMMAEFKKIRGSAIGVTGFAQNNPPMIAVLYPGRSDALRGLILAGLGMAGTPGQPIDGMQIVNIKNGNVAAAYDDRVVIVAQPASQLEWSVKQYKHTISEPTLASSRGSFRKLDKNQRQKNALTLWADVSGLYAGVTTLFPSGDVPPGVVRVNAMFDFANIDDFILTESIESNRLGLQAGLQFKEGHSCLAYDLIRTPNLSKAALQAVPPGAIAVASFSLNQTDPMQAATLRAQVQTLTGLDLGREIFANIEQVSLFILPGDGAPGTVSQLHELLMSRLGVAITSRDPAQTRQILNTVLNALYPGKNDTDAGHYVIAANGAQMLNCYMEQASGVTVLSLNHDVVKAATDAINHHASVLNSGALHEVVDRVTPATSKLLLLNVGGVLRIAGPQADASSLRADEARQLNDSFEQIARAADSTTLQIRTDEQPGSFTLNAELTGIPPLNEVVGPVTQFASLRDHARAESDARELRQEIAATISPATRPPALDGNLDDVWNSAHPYALGNVLVQSPSGKHATAEYRGLWDNNNLYVLVDVTDNTLHHDHGPEVAKYDTDGIELYLDATDSKSPEFSDTDYEYGFNWDQTAPEMMEYKHGHTNGVQYVMVTTDKGYRLAARFPWSTLGTKPATGAKIGLDVHVNDNQGHGKREAKVSWHDKHDEAWHDPRAFGNAELAGLVGWWKFDETQGDTARDSSGGNHDGTLIGKAKWAPGRIGGAVALDGAGSFVKIADEAAFDFGGQLTVAAWVNIHSVPSDWTAIVAKGDSAWRLSTVNSDRKIHFSVNRFDRTGGVRSSTTLGADEWHHIAAVYDGETMSVYIDGKLDSSQPWPGGIAKNNFDVLIGENAEQTGRSFNGLIDDVRLYDYALSESEIKGLAAGQ
jgi:hypothetical protein